MQAAAWSHWQQNPGYGQGVPPRQRLSKTVALEDGTLHDRGDAPEQREARAAAEPLPGPELRDSTSDAKESDDEIGNMLKSTGAVAKGVGAVAKGIAMKKKPAAATNSHKKKGSTAASKKPVPVSKTCSKTTTICTTRPSRPALKAAGPLVYRACKIYTSEPARLLRMLPIGERVDKKSQWGVDGKLAWAGVIHHCEKKL
jgi:hypothetical protein